MARNLELALTLAAKDTASKVLKKAMQDTIAQTKAVEKADDQLGKSQKQNSDSAIQASKALRSEYQQSAKARSTLGIRAERDIQREIQLTQAAYNRLTRSGVMSANEQSRAFEAMTSRVSKLRGELNSAGQSMSRMERAKGWGSNAMAIAGGVTAAGAVLAQPVNNQMTYERKLADMSNTAFADQGISGRKAGMQQMDSLIRETVKTGGGNKDSAADTLNALLASGAVDFSSAKTLLPVIQKYATASGADPKDLAQIAIRLKQTFGIQDQDIGKALNMALAAGQAGSFELSDQAKYLPAQLAAASNLGMKGLGDFSTILGLNQAAAITSGDSSQAGVNVTDLLLKINSKDAATAAARVKINGHGIDLPGTLSAARAKGINPLEAFNRVVDKVVGNNPEYQKLESRLKTAKGGERQEIMEAQKKLLEGSGIGQIIADQQALFALVGYRANKKYFNDVVSGANQQRDLPDGQRAGDVNYGLIQDTNDYKTDQLKNVRDFSEMDSIKSLSDVLGNLSKELTDYSSKYPELTTAISGATTGIKALAAVAAAVAGIRILTGGGIPGFGKKGGGKFNPTDILTGEKSGVVPVYVTNWQNSDGNNGSKNSRNGIKGPLGSLLGSFSGYAGSAFDLSDRLDSAKQEADAKGISVGQLMVDRANAHKDQLTDDTPLSWWSKPSTIGMDAGSDGTGVPSYLRPQQQQYPFIPIQIQNTMMLDGKVVAESTNEVNASQANRGSTGGY
ncbi:phage tail tape measure protein [Obesumbacterium proteus]|uniref:Phage protein n=1 Tax=Obesumbacterium proteus ATCC 12841 TaxID=1354268 RepID=A0AA91IPR3_9GAMM|nr:phage tail tape measure protein [Obesumbacterium proteus]AMO79714.1 phage tail tape measure protein [Obesumbacterium proteus]OAT58975.1 phage protein [Obesumbacterium proteus ATCC 12841]